MSVFGSEIRFDQTAAEEIGSALNDPRFTAGIATAAPDGGSWITAAARPGWWEHPGGGAKDQPLFAAADRFAAGMDPAPPLAPGERASCADSADQVALNEVALGIATTLAIGPTTIFVGKDMSEQFVVVAGSTNINTDTSFLTLTVHRLTRSCIVAPAPPPTAVLFARQGR